jgi:hypothetical protein
MASLTINGHSVTVDDSFLSLSPDQQNATVDEIAASLPKGPAAPAPSAAPGFGDRYGDGPTARGVQAASAGYNGLRADDPGNPNVALGNELTRVADERLVGPNSFRNRLSTTLMSAANTAGMNMPTNLAASLTTLRTGRPFHETFREEQEQQAALARQSPGAADLGTAGGIVGSFGLPVANVFGAATLPARIGNSAATVGAYSGVSSLAGEGLDKAAETPTIARALMHAGVGAAFGGALHGGLETVGHAVGRISDRVTPPSAASGHAAVPANVFPKGVSPAIAQEAEAARFGIDLTRGQATGDYAQQAAEAMTARGGGDTAPGRMMREFFARQEQQVGAAKAGIGEELAGGRSVVDSPYDAGALVADRARGVDQLARTVAEGHAAAAERAADGLRPVDPVNAAADVAQGLRDRAAADRGQFRSSYEAAAQEPGAFQRGAFDNVGQSVENRINASERPIPIDPVLTPAASRAIADLRQMPRIADPEAIGPSMQDVDQFRKRLVSYRNSTSPQNPTDRAAMDQVINHFDQHVEDALSSGLFSGSDRALDLYRQARAQFARYQRTYRPQGAGDDIGRAMRQIVDRDASPQEVANLLYGTGVAGNTGKAMRLAERLQQVLPEPLWQQTQQGYIGRILGNSGDHGELVNNIQKALSGEGRGLTYRMLSDEQVAGLRSMQTALRTAKAAREAVPEWIQKLAKADFEPRAVVDSLFGKSTLTGSTVSVQYAKGVRDLVGPESETWAAVRQAGWQHLTTKPEGVTADHGPQAIANRLATFLEGHGKGLANILYTAEERAVMKAFANTMKMLTPKRVAGGSASPNSDTAPMLMRTMETLQKHEAKITRLLALAGLMKGGPAGAAAAYGVGRGVQSAVEAAQARAALKRAKEATSGAPAVAMPRVQRRAPALPRFHAPLGVLVGG